MALTPAQWQTMALRMAGCLRQNALFEIAFAISTSGGVFKFGFNGDQTGPLPYNVTAEDFRLALVALPSIGADGVKINGIRKGPYYVEMTGANSGQIVPEPVIDGSQLDPPHTPFVNERRNGQPDDYTGDADMFWNDENIATAANDKIRMLNVAYQLIIMRMGKLSTIVDTQTGQVDQTIVKGSQLMKQAETQKNIIEAELQKLVNAIHIGDTKRTQFGVMSAGTPNGLPLYQMQYRNGRFG
jgi:hypothetical protein